MKITLAQVRSLPGEVAVNERMILHHIRVAADSGSDLIVLPEMSDTGYDMPIILQTASAWEGGVYEEIAAVAAEKRITVVVGLSERVGEDIYNTVAVIGPEGRLIAKYRKIHLITAEPICEHRFLKAGNHFTVCKIHDFTVGLMTCYDIRFPEMARRLSLLGADLLVVPAAWPMVRLEHWKTILACRAIENQVYVAAVNRVGTDNGLAFCGASRLLDPYGTLLASASEIDETLFTGEISRERIAEVRDRLKVYQDRREDLYSKRDTAREHGTPCDS